jgi:peptidoglycan/xylan/chitin deacetylase (PgdA/CDA1 family)
VRPWVSIFLGFKVCACALALLHHPRLAILVFFAPDPWIFMQFILPSHQAFGPAATTFETPGRNVWLTIDDGPDPASTPALLGLLERNQAKATFFVVGRQVERHPDLARMIVSKGHSIANHTHTHPSWTFWGAGPGRTASEIDRCVAALLLADVPFERYFRPPVGVRNPFLQPELASRGMLLVLWNARGLDGGRRRPQAALSRITRQIRPGGILLAHESGVRPAQRLEFVGLLLRHLSDEGYRCVLPARDALRT